jgi:4-hydroxy-3-polyprenylbenzoate decarboxylase
LQLTLSELGAVIMPPMITYYNKPNDLNDLNRHIIAKVLDRFGIEVNGFNRWGEDD